MRLYWTTTAPLLLALTACTDPGADPSDPEVPGVNEEDVPLGPPEQCGDRTTSTSSPDERDMNLRADLELGTALLAELSPEDDNVLLSPYSLRTAFGQVLAGTQGDSRPEIEAVLGFSDLGERTQAVLNAVSQDLESRNAEQTETRPEVIVRPINRSFFDVAYEDSVNDDWLATVQSFYGTCIEVFDMNADPLATMEYVNGWVADQTNDLIPNLVTSLPETVSLILVNAFYFKASWSEAFAESLTRDGTF
ncbi:MAG: serpin family protein, partial [Nannocystaceae bacterium]